MATTSAIDQSTLGWVKTEIDESLKQARQALESYVDDPGDDTQLRFCSTHLHQVTGTLEMVELDGAALLARENETLADMILRGDLDPTEKTYDVLTRGILSLPDYLARLQAGEPDVPLRLLPIVNEIREQYGEKKLDEIEFFNPDLSVRPPRHDPDAPALEEEEVREIARKLRPRFQVALLGWLRDTGSEDAINNMVEVLDKLGQDTHLGVVQQLFWVASGLLEAMLNGELEATNDRKKLFSRLDQQIRKLIEGKGKSELRNSSETLVKKILYQVGQVSANTPRVSELRQAFDLDLLLGRVATSTDLDMEALPTPEVLASVANALSTEIYEAQEMLATYFDPDQRDTQSLKRLLELLDKMSSTMGMLGAPLLKSLVDDLNAATVAIDEQRIEPSEGVSMLMARALLLIESSSRDISRSAADWKRQIDQVSGALRSLAEGGDGVPTVDGLEVTDGELTESDFMQLFGVVATEVRAGLQQVEEGFEAFASDSSQKGILGEIIEQLGQIEGALQIVGQDVVAELVSKTIAYVTNIRAGQLRPGEKVLDALAICIGTIGAYVDGVQFNRPNLDDLVNMATSELQSAADAEGVVLKVVGDDYDAGTALEVVDDASADDLADTVESREAPEADLAVPSSAGVFDDEDLDEEIMEIFVEDARDSINTINKNFPSWRDDRSNRDALLEVRRGFHTIKGSGRMVGAGEIAELSWSIENMLNKVRDERLEVSPEVLDLIEQVRIVLPDMVSQLEGGPAPAADVEALRLRAHELADGKVPTESRSQSAAAPVEYTSAPVAEVSRTASETEVPELDEALLQIFTSEAEGHISTIHTELAQCREQGSCFASPSLIRAAHTLAGSARSVGLDFMSATCKEMEKLLQELDEKQAVLSGTQLKLLEGVAEAVGNLLTALGEDRSQLPETTRRFNELGSALHAELEQLAAAGADTGSEEVVSAPAGIEAPVAAPAILKTDVAQDEIDPELIEFFYEEAVDILQNINAAQNRWRENLGDMNAVSELKRALHTFKGGARMSGAMSLGGVAHNTETLIGRVEQGQMSAGTDLIDLLDEIHDVLAHGIEQIKANEVASGLAEINQKIEGLMSAGGQAAPAQAPEASPDTLWDTPDMAEQEIVATPVAPPPAAPMPPTSPVESLRDELDPELVDIFYEEALDILQNINDAQARWRKSPESRETVAELKRALHTFKGGARMAGAMSLGGLAHNTETLISRIEQGQMQVNGQIMDLLDEIHDSLAQGVAQISRGETVSGLEGPSRHLDAVLAGVGYSAQAPSQAVEEPASEAGANDMTDAAPVDTISSDPVDTPVTSALPVIEVEEEEILSRTEAIAKGTSTIVENKTPEKAADRKEQIRVRTDLLDTLVNYAGEVSISRARMEQQIFGFRENLGELSQNVVRFRDQLRELEIQSESQIVARAEQVGVEDIEDFDPLEFDRFSRLQQLSRSLTESLHDLSTIQNSLGNFASEAETVLQQQARVNTELQEGLMRTRMVSFSTQSTRLRHIVRQTSRELGKQAQFEIEGAEVELDRNVLERMIGPFEHMIRNSLDHGLEPEEERARTGKPASGKIRIETRQEGNEIAIYFSDDGRGLNIPAIRKKAIEKGFMSHDGKLSDEEVTQFILMPGFSTAEKVTHISGRGVGMDVVHNEVKQLGGTMSVQSDLGQGTTFVIRLPLTLSIAQALMVYVGEQLYATPLSVIENIIELPVTDVESISLGEEPLLKYNNEVYPFMQLGGRLDVPSVPRNPKKTPILLVKSGNRVVAVQVDGLAGTREIVIKSVGAQLNEVKGIAGATILGDGTVVLIVDLQDLWVSDDMMHLADVVTPAEVEEAPVRAQPLVMVVDDSLTVRKITSKHLVKRGIEALTAKDGLDAVEQLRDHIPDVMLVDIEMPRMDGYELTTRVRSTDEWKHIPIIMITSRAGQKHRDKAMDLGVDVYMSKPYQEEQLFEAIEQLIKTGRAQ